MSVAHHAPGICRPIIRLMSGPVFRIFFAIRWTSRVLPSLKKVAGNYLEVPFTYPSRGRVRRDHKDAPVIAGRITVIFNNRDRAPEMMGEDCRKHPDIEYAGAVAGDREILALEAVVDLQRERVGARKCDPPKTVRLPECVHLCHHVRDGLSRNPGGQDPAHLFTGPAQHRVDVDPHHHRLRPEGQHAVAEERDNVVIGKGFVFAGTVMVSPDFYIPVGIGQPANGIGREHDRTLPAVAGIGVGDDEPGPFEIPEVDGDG